MAISPGRWSPLSLLPALLLAAASCEATPTDGAEPLNFVFIIADDLGQRDLGCYGSTFYETPRLDALARSGVRFTSAYAACPVCSPTRASIQTGKYPARLHTTEYFGGPQPEQALQLPRFQNRKLLPARYLDRLPHDETTIAEALSEAGYATFFAGKWHLGPRDHWPEFHGYDHNVGGWAGGGPRSYFSPYQNPALPDGPSGEHLDDRLSRETARFIEGVADRPFLAFFSLYDVHIPLMTTAELKAKYTAKAAAVAPGEARFAPEGNSSVRLVQDHPVYAGMIESMDQAVGHVLDSLEATGVADRTVVIFTSDNGGLSTAEGSPTSNWPLRAGKGWLYEGGLRVPLIVRWPGVARPGTVVDSYVTSPDYYPTMLEMADLAQRPKQHLDGRSFVPLLQGVEELDRGPIYWHYPHYGNQGGSPGAAIRDGVWKLIEFFENGSTELYNLAQDPSEQQNLADTQPERLVRLRDQLHQWQRSVDARMTSPNPQHAPAP